MTFIPLYKKSFLSLPICARYFHFYPSVILLQLPVSAFCWEGKKDAFEQEKGSWLLRVKQAELGRKDRY